MTDERATRRTTAAAFVHALPAIAFMTLILWTLALTGAVSLAFFIDLELIGVGIGLALFGAPALWANWHLIRLAVAAEREFPA